MDQHSTNYKDDSFLPGWHVCMKIMSVGTMKIVEMLNTEERVCYFSLLELTALFPCPKFIIAHVSLSLIETLAPTIKPSC